MALTTSWISSVQTFLIFLCSTFSGRYFDSHGTRNLLISGSVLFIGSLVGIACKCDGLLIPLVMWAHVSLPQLLAIDACACRRRFLRLDLVFPLDGRVWTLVPAQAKYRGRDCRLRKRSGRCHLPYHD
jgi:hypothetical protein